MLNDLNFGQLLRLRGGGQALYVKFWKRRNRHQIVTDGGILLFVDADGRERRNEDGSFDVVKVVEVVNQP